MQIVFKDNEIILSKAPSPLDNFVMDFVQILRNHNIKHVITSGYVANLFGQDRTNEEVNILIQHITFEKFLKSWLEFEKEYECLNTADPIDAYNAFLVNHHAIGIARKGSHAPNIKLKFIKNEHERFTLKHRKTVRIDDKILFISPLEILILSDLSQGFEKDIEDAKYLFKLFKKELNLELMERFRSELKIPSESINKYLLT
ncbi:MAG: hypothetical protein FIB08_11730 [Candidatus Methanoperedens sp.]|nr:hypothetical protein [Candidatus Methanoperedens sp.]